MSGARIPFFGPRRASTTRTDLTTRPDARAWAAETRVRRARPRSGGRPSGYIVSSDEGGEHARTTFPFAWHPRPPSHSTDASRGADGAAHAFREEGTCASAPRASTPVVAAARVAATRRSTSPATSGRSPSTSDGPNRRLRRGRARRRGRLHPSRVADGVLERRGAGRTRAAMDGRIGARHLHPAASTTRTPPRPAHHSPPDHPALNPPTVALRQGSRAPRRAGRTHDMGAARAVGRARPRVHLRHRPTRLERPALPRPRLPLLARSSPRPRGRRADQRAGVQAHERRRTRLHDGRMDPGRGPRGPELLHRRRRHPTGDYTRVTPSL